MATLEKIRQKQGCLVTVIGLALVLFIVTLTDFDFVRSCGRGGSSTELIAGGVKIDKEDVDKVYQRYLDNMDKSRFNSDQMRQMLLIQLAQQAMVNKECKSLGISASPKLLGQIIENDQQLYYQLAQIMSAANPPVQLMSMQQAKALIDNPNGQDPQAIAAMKSAWMAREQEITDQFNQIIYGQLVSGLFTANDLDAKSLYNDNNTYSSVSYVTTPVVAPDSLAITDADRRAVYDHMKSQFFVPAYRSYIERQQNSYNYNYQPTTFYSEPVRVIDVAAVLIQPSAEDKAKTYSEFAAFIDTLSKTTEHVAAPQSASLEQFAGFAATLKDNRSLQQTLGVDAETLAGILASDSIYFKPTTAANDQHAAIKVSNIDQRVDSVQASFRVALGATPSDTIESLQYWILPGTQNAEVFNGLAGEYMRLIPNLDSQESIMAFQQMMGEVNDLVLTADVKAPVEYTDSVNDIHIVMTVDKRNPKKSFVTGTLYTAQAHPSGQTLLDLRSRLSNISTGSAAADLADSVRTQNINFRDMYVDEQQIVGASTPYISLGGSRPIENSREAVKWAMEKKVGDISPVFENTDVIYVVAIREAIKDQYVPMNSILISDFIDHMARAQKQGEEQMANFKGTTLAEYAGTMGQSVQIDPQYSFNGTRILNQAPELNGQIAAAAPGQLVGPVVIGDQIVVFTVADQKEPTMPFVAANYTRDFVNKFSPQNLFLMLAGKDKVNNYGLKFIASDEEIARQQAMQAKQKK